MTIVVWDGKTLAADRMTSNGSAGSLKSHRTSETTKIILFPNKPRFGDKGQHLLAAAYSGTVSMFSTFHDIVFKGMDDPVNADVDYYGRVQIAKDMQLAAPSMSALYLVSDDKGKTHADVLTWANPDGSPARRGRFFKAGRLATIGSGSVPCRVFFSRMKGVDSIQLVHLATKYAPGCGLGIDYFQPGWDELKRIKELGVEDKVKIAQLFADTL